MQELHKDASATGAGIGHDSAWGIDVQHRGVYLHQLSGRAIITAAQHIPSRHAALNAEPDTLRLPPGSPLTGTDRSVSLCSLRPRWRAPCSTVQNAP